MQQVPGLRAATGGRVSGRLASLDGLRGLAALVVVVHHCALAAPVLAEQLRTPDPNAPSAWLAFSPVHLFWAGGEAVLVFFVLSGLVLVKPFLRRARAGRWPAYYRKRMVRLYVPVFGAVVLTFAVLTLVPRTGGADWGWWMAAHVGPADPQLLLHDALLLDGTGWQNSALWSLRLEVLFSLLLPLYVVVARELVAPLWLTLPATCWAVYWTAANGHETISHLCVFAVGALLARDLDALQRVSSRISAARLAPARWAAVLTVGLVLLGARWWPRLLLAEPPVWLAPAGRAAVVLGAAVLVFCFLGSPGVRRFGESRPLQWLGTVSFSLYLVHEPLVVSVATTMPPSLRSLPVVMGAGVALSLVLALAFHHAVERPSQQLATWAGHLGRGRAVPTSGAERVAPPVARPRAARRSAPVSPRPPVRTGPSTVVDLSPRRRPPAVPDPRERGDAAWPITSPAAPAGSTGGATLAR
ncbi:acyltransferase family protein [Modestobacter sp. SYSU DS0290]